MTTVKASPTVNRRTGYLAGSALLCFWSALVVIASALAISKLPTSELTSYLSVAFILALAGTGFFWHLYQQYQSDRQQVLTLCQALRDGHYRKRVKEHSPNAQSIALNDLAREQEQMLQALSSAASEINYTSQELDQVTRTLVSGADEQQSQLDSIATASEETAVTVKEISTHVQATLKSALELKQLSEQGEQQSETLDGALNQSLQIFSDTQQVLGQLSEQTEAIGSFINTIDEVSSQTNLLALNAAIEAARAGEAGRGFAVVADEVRGLAAQTAEAANQITTLVNNVNDAVSTTGKEFTRCREVLQQGAETGQELRQGLLSVADFSDRTEKMIASIEQAIQEHESAGHSISERMNRMSQLSAEHHLKVRDALEIVEYLEQVAEKLSRYQLK